jgi:anthranilate synthase component 1
VIPVYAKIKALRLRPADAYLALREGSENSFLLESAEIGEKIARYSFLGAAPHLVVKVADGMAELHEQGKSTSIKLDEACDPVDLLRKLVKLPTSTNLPRFFGGVVGYFSYDLVRYWVELEDKPDEPQMYDAQFMGVLDCVIFDHWNDEVVLVANALMNGQESPQEMYQDCVERLGALEERAKLPVDRPKLSLTSEEVKAKSNMAKEEFKSSVQKAKDYIVAGDILQVVLSRRLQTEFRSEPFKIYLALKHVNPSPYMYFLEFGDLHVIGSSPEMLIRVEGREVVTRPIAGTRPRGRTRGEDEELAREMLNDPKERAEHIMLVDLARNDVGKVSEFGSLTVTDLMTIEKYSHVQHIVSNVVGRLRKDKDSFDALKAAFPAGTVVGAPKVRAMEIINELEPTRRGIYAGGVGYFSFKGDMDFAITIRTVVTKDNTAFLQVGAGIVAYSDPEREFVETENKGKAMLRAIELAGGAE